MADAFISYVEEDSAVAADVASVLREGGVSSWRYEADAVGGENYLLQTRAEIEGCGVFLLVLSRASLASEQVDREVVRAHECGKPILPILRDLPYPEFARRRPAWQQAMGAATALTVPDEGVAELRVRLLAGARAALGRARRRDADAAADPFRVRLSRFLRARRTRRAAIVALVLAGAVAFGANAWLERRDAEARRVAAENQHAATEAKAEAVRLFDAFRPQDALVAIERARALAPNDTEVDLLHGRAHFDLGETEKALPYLDRRLAASPRDPIALYWRGRIHDALGHLAPALADLTAAIDALALPEDLYVEASHVRGMLLLDRNAPKHPLKFELTQPQRREVEDAVRDLTFVIERRGRVSALVDRGRGRSWLSLDADAHRDFVEAYRRASSSGRSEDAPLAANAAYFLGMWSLRAAQRDHGVLDLSRAVESFDVSLSHDPGMLKSKMGRAVARAGLGFVPEGIQELEDALRGVAPDDPMHAVLTDVIAETRKAAAAMPVNDLVVAADRIEGPEGLGVEFRVTCTVRGREGVPCRAILRVFEVARSPYLHQWEPLQARDDRYALSDGSLGVTSNFTPTKAEARVVELPLYLPYAQTPMYDGPQRYEFSLILVDAAGPISRVVTGNFSFTKSVR